MSSVRCGAMQTWGGAMHESWGPEDEGVATGLTGWTVAGVVVVALALWAVLFGIGWLLWSVWWGLWG